MSMNDEFIDDLYKDRNELYKLVNKLHSYSYSIKLDNALLQDALTDLMSAQGSFNKYVSSIDKKLVMGET